MNSCLEPKVQWPDSMQALRVEDSVLGQGYESVPPAQRACIKTGIAFQHVLYGEQPKRREECVCDHDRGFVYRVTRSPAAWTLLLLGADYAAAPRLVAALMPALLARVPLVGVACVGALPTAATCASLELMGIEDVFCFADAKAAQKALRQLAECVAECVAGHSPKQHGRVLFMHKGDLASVEQTARRIGLVTWQECTAPHITVQRGNTHDTALLRWCHPDVTYTEVEWAQDCSADAVFCAPPDRYTVGRGIVPVPLLLEAGAEGLWWHQDLEPQFFLRKRLLVACTDTLNEEAPV